MEINFALGRWAPATRRSYEDAWRDFCAYCAMRDAQPMPAKPETVAGYLTARSATLAVSTLSVRLAAIVAVHDMKRKPLRVKGSAIRDAVAEIRRVKGSAKIPKAALVMDDFKRVIAGIPAEALQDRAVLLIGFASAMRRSELVALNVEDLTFTPDDLTIIVRRSKTDKDGKGATVAILRTPTAYCAVAALEAWLHHAEITSGPIFRTSHKTRMWPRTVADIAKRWAANAGLDARVIGAHSLRRGCITSMFRGGAKLEEIMRHSRHSTPAIALGYVEAHAAVQNPALRALGL